MTVENVFKSGFITIIGAPNAGKSTLMNRIVGQKVSVVSQRAQTTRNKIMGVYHAPSLQMIFIDTPGVTGAKNKLGEYMVKVAYDALNEVEAILYIVDSSIGLKEKDDVILERLSHAKAPVIAAVNKIDISTMKAVDDINTVLSQKSYIKHILPICASDGDGVDKLINLLSGYMPQGPQYFPPDMVTDVPERFICAEMIREKTLIFLRDEIPHGIGVDIERIAPHEGRDDMLDVHAVKFKHDWRNSGSMLRELGYE